MGLLGSIFGTKSKTKPIVVGPMGGYLNDYAGAVNAFSKTDPNSYVAGPSQLQQQAFSSTGNLGAGSANLSAATKYARQGAAGPAGSVDFGGYEAPQAEGVNALETLPSWMNPYMDDVVATTLANYDVDAERRLGDMRAAAARNRAFGGSGYAVGEALLGGELGRERAALEAGLRSDAFNTGAGFALSDASRRDQLSMFNTGLGADAARFAAEAENQEQLTNQNLREQAYLRALQAAGIIADVGNAESANARADLATLAGLGEMQRQIEQEQLNAPLTMLQATGQLYGNIPQASYIGQKSKGSPGVGGLLGSGLQSAAIAFSDRRLKRDIMRIGTLAGGLGLYLYRYLWEDGFRTGVMADEVARLRPNALGPVIGGFATVDYARI
jgi:hypothetical protein